ncbi:MAG: hypothetical protein AAGI44_19390 [Pseudomonadota bacterium]
MDDFFRFYDIETDATRADWVLKRCDGPQGTLHTVVPSGFTSYARICHPAWSVEPLDPNDSKAWEALRAGWSDVERLTPIRWEEVAPTNNQAPHRLMHWHDICSPVTRESGMAGIDPPREGELTIDMIESLFAVLGDLYGPDLEIFCGIWEGYNLPIYRKAMAKFESYSGQQSYLIFSSTLSRMRSGWLAAYSHARHHHSTEIAGLVPNAIWPYSCDWYLASPYNLPSSYIGGSVDLVNRISRAVNLETYQALPGDNLYK